MIYLLKESQSDVRAEPSRRGPGAPGAARARARSGAERAAGDPYALPRMSYAGPVRTLR